MLVFMRLSSTSTPPSAEWLRWRLLSFLFSSFLWWDLSFLAICCGGLIASDSSSSPLHKHKENIERLIHTHSGIRLAVNLKLFIELVSCNLKHLSSVESSRVYGEFRIVISIFWSRSSPSSGVSLLASRSSVCGTRPWVNCTEQSRIAEESVNAGDTDYPKEMFMFMSYCENFCDNC